MRMNEIGGSHSEMNHMTNCIHDTRHHLEGKAGGGAESASNASLLTREASDRTREPFSLSVWLQNTLAGAKRLFGKIWGSSGENLSGGTAANTTDSDLHSSQIEAASVGVQPARNFNNNPYFTAVSEHTDPRQNIWQKIRVRFQNVTGFLTKRFSFGGGSSFHTEQERPREDLRRHSRYREDELEIDCILTDDSYLLDSYNEKGEYSRLSGDSRANMSVRK